MRVRAKTALGVEVSSTQVCMALVRRERRGPVLVRAARAALPAGTIQDGRVADPAALTKALVDLKARCKGRPERTAVSLFGTSVRLQILELPNPLPANVGAFVQGEIKQLVTLAAGQVMSDFCSLVSDGPRRLLAATADGDVAMSLVEACERARLRIDVVEPSLLAVIRGLYAMKIAERSGRMVLLAVLREQGLEMCVFRAGHLEFMRSRDMTEVWSDPEALAKQLAGEIQAVVQYYDVEVVDTCLPWQITILPEEGVKLPDDATRRLKPRGARAEVDILTPAQVPLALGVECDDAAVLAETSPVAVGLTLPFLTAEDDTPQLSLLPSQITRKRVVRRQALIAAVCAAAVLLVMALFVMGLRFKIENRWARLVGQKMAESFEETVALVTQQRQVDARIEQVSTGQGRLGEVLKAQRQIDWPGVLGDVRDMAPKGLRITHLTSGPSDSPEMLIDGWSLNYGAISLFANKLNKSPFITSATVVKSGQEEMQGRMYFVYQIRCAFDAKVGI